MKMINLKYLVIRSICFSFLLSSLYSQAQNTLMFSGQVWLNNNSSSISEVTNYGLLNEKSRFNSRGIVFSAGMRLNNAIGLEFGAGLNRQMWNYEDGTLAFFTNGLESNRFSNKMGMGQIHLGLHTTIKKDGVNFIYLKGVFDANLVTNGDYWNDDPRGIGPQRIYTVNYNNPMGFYTGPELGLFLKADEKSELSIWGSYKIGFGSLFDFNYLLSGSGNYAEYNIDGRGNKVEIGVINS